MQDSYLGVCIPKFVITFSHAYTGRNGLRCDGNNLRRRIRISREVARGKGNATNYLRVVERIASDA